MQLVTRESQRSAQNHTTQDLHVTIAFIISPQPACRGEY